MSTILDVDLHHEFWPDLKEARTAALVEAANTGGVVISVDAVEIQPQSVTFIGTVPELALNSASSWRCGTRLGSLHTTWGSVLRPAGIIGYLVVGHPITCQSYETKDPDFRRVAIKVDRTFTSIPTAALGPLCCAQCRQPIPSERLRAIPGVRVCVTCQTAREEIHHGN
jgi:hypothetical protein